METENLTGKTGENVIPDVKTYEGFTPPNKTAAAVKGDINNNGKIDASDLLQVKSHIKRVKLLEGDDFTTADIDGNGSINAADLPRMKAHMKGVTLIWE